ncbi:type II toxin-antitoxin system prevent-host-death family antitoxin [Pseudomonas sp. PNPG3]|uniref:type II toxin-antitoxin system Phd/YefM family antitoxin n=1 Tax=Pseudomonas sp. PNPG3 TaxID=2919497 RepID=UPI001FFC402D|nr:type II toxin-antitoxin system prevent-host-death family antitoxin [Pseudomonas sp. PNPG3]MCK2122120.1 type II toxin-antitoxin system prevent-host-death family antitoxin [Pseudomonas sp. PNPG3]
MNVLTFSQARAGLKQALDDVCRDHEPALITRQRGDHVVILSLEDYKSMEETLYLLGSGENAKRLRESIALHKAGKAVTKRIPLNVTAEQEAEE